MAISMDRSIIIAFALVIPNSRCFRIDPKSKRCMITYELLHFQNLSVKSRLMVVPTGLHNFTDFKYSFFIIQTV
ncbi:hypothetical protein FF021_12845 [Leptospira noguchii]|nr:hypothetical protein FF021_12845 [Leptospira noguchii]